MAVKTYTGTGLWSTAANWSGGTLPIDGDSIAAANSSADLTLDVDITGWATGLAASTWIGTLNVSQTPGTYGIKFGGTFTNNGVVNICGATETDPLPSDVQVNFTSTANTSMFAGNGVYNIRCAEPVRPWTTLKTAVNAGATKLYVDHSLEGGEWTAGRYVRVDNVNKAQQSEEVVIASVGNDGGGDFITFSSGLASAKIVGTMVILTSRNIQATGNSGGAQYCFNAITAQNCTVNLGVRNFNRGATGCTKFTVSGGAWSGNSNGWNYCYSNTVSNGVWSGSNYGWNSCNSNTVTGGVWSGNSNGWNSCNSNTVTSGVWSGNTNGWYLCYSNTVTNGSLSGNAYNFRRCAFSTKNTTFTDGVLYSDCNALYLVRNAYGEQIDFQGIPGGYSARTAGGEVSRVGGTGPLTHTCEDATAPCFTQTQFRIPAGRTVRAETTGTRSDSGVACELQILDVYLDPLVTGDTDDYLARAVQTQTTETLAATWTNTTTQPVDVLVRVSAMAASGTYEQTTISGLTVQHGPLESEFIRAAA